MFQGAVALKLPFSYDPTPLAAELRAEAGRLWRPKGGYASQFHNGRWTSIALLEPRTSGERALVGPIRWTAVARSFPRLVALIESVPARPALCFLSRLEPGAVISLHVDRVLRCENRGLITVHLPITTNPHVRFFVGGKRVDMAPGEAWALDTTRPHAVYNLSRSCSRVHLTALFFDDARLGAMAARSEACGRSVDPAESSRRYLDSFAPRQLQAKDAGRRRMVLQTIAALMSGEARGDKIVR